MGSYVQVGVFGAKGNDKQGNITLAQLAVIHEFGSPKNNIPSRPFMRLTFEKHRTKYAQFLKGKLDEIAAGTIDIKRVLDLLGLMVASDMKATIAHGSLLKPLAKSTIAARTLPTKSGKKSRKINRKVRPLFDTGQLIKAISYKTFIRHSTIAVESSFAGDS